MWLLWIVVAMMLFGALSAVLKEKGSDRTKGLIAFSLVLAALGSGLWWYYDSQQRREERSSAAAKAREADLQRKISQFAGQYEAVADWMTGLEESRVYTDAIYSVELSPLFIRADGRPVLFVAALRDVDMQATQYIAHLEGVINFRSKFQLNLNCTAEKARTLLQSDRGSLNRYAVVAQIKAVSSGEESPQGETVIRPLISVVTGTCIDIMPLGPSNAWDTSEFLKWKLYPPKSPNAANSQ